jgi:hypothetical protein
MGWLVSFGSLGREVNIERTLFVYLHGVFVLGREAYTIDTFNEILGSHAIDDD